MRLDLLSELKRLREENAQLAMGLIDAKEAAKENWHALMEAELEITLLKARLYDRMDESEG